MKKNLLLTLAFLFLATPCFAENISLFKDFNYGMTKDEVLARGNIVACQDAELEGNLCASDSLNFMGEQWYQIFSFTDNVLNQILLLTELSEDKYVKMVSNITKNEFVLLLASSSIGTVSLFDYLDKSQEAFQQALVDWETRSFNAENFSITFFDKNSIITANKNKKAKDMVTFYAQAPVETRAVELKILDDVLALSFIVPIKALKDMQKESDANNESF